MSDPIPHFNHVALSVPAAGLDEAGQTALVDFYGEVFGWTAMPMMSKPGELLVLRAWSNEQFVYLHGSERPMQGGEMDHWGLSVPRVEDLDGMYARAQAFQQRASEVELSERKLEDFKAVKLHSFYVRYRLPLWVEVQHFEWAPGVGAQSLPDA